MRASILGSEPILSSKIDRPDKACPRPRCARTEGPDHDNEYERRRGPIHVSQSAQTIRRFRRGGRWAKVSPVPFAIRTRTPVRQRRACPRKRREGKSEPDDLVGCQFAAKDHAHPLEPKKGRIKQHGFMRAIVPRPRLAYMRHLCASVLVGNVARDAAPGIFRGRRMVGMHTSARAPSGTNSLSSIRRVATRSIR